MSNPVDVVTFAEVNDAWAAAQQAINLAATADRRECEAAKMFADWHDCKDTDKLLEKVDLRLTLLSDAVQRVDAAVGQLATMDVVVDLLGKRDGWHAAKVELETLSGQLAQHLKIDAWTGVSADQYHAQLPVQQDALSELAGLAAGQAKANDQVALINCLVFLSARAGLQAIRRYAIDHSSPQVNEAAETVQHVDWPTAHYLYRAWTLERRLDAYARWLHAQVNPATAAWTKAARDLDSSLTGVLGSSALLKKNGGWPSVGAADLGQVADRSRVATTTVNQQQAHLGQQGGYYTWK